MQSLFSHSSLNYTHVKTMKNIFSVLKNCDTAKDFKYRFIQEYPAEGPPLSSSSSLFFINRPFKD